MKQYSWLVPFLILPLILATPVLIRPTQPELKIISPESVARLSNYAGGSCVHCSLQEVLHHQGQDELADWWRKTYRGGERATSLIRKLERLDIPFAYTMTGDPAFLEWVSETQRMAVIFYKPMHAITFVGFVGDKAKVLDNNRPDQYEYIDKAIFLYTWKTYYSGFALTTVYDPPAPPMWRS